MPQELFHDSTMRPFNDGWLFTAPGAETEQAVTLPHAWNAEGWSYANPQFRDPVGTGRYRRILGGEVRSGDLLKFEGVSARCRVFLDGKPVAENLGAYKSFEVRLDPVREDSELVLEVTDKTSLELLPEGEDAEFVRSPRYTRWPVAFGSSLRSGGIWREVHLVRRPAVYMEVPAVEVVGTRFEVLPKLRGDVKNHTVRMTLSDGAESVSVTVPAAAVKTPLQPGNPAFSWPLAPHPYRLTSELLDPAGTVIQTIVQPLLLLRLEVRDSDFRLNGKPYFLRGQNGFPHCNIPHDREYIEQFVSAYRAQGVEISRFHTEPPPHAWLDECDRQGVMVILEMPIHGSFGCYSYGSKRFEANELPEILSLVEEYRRHPSVVIWCMGNELIVACERDAGLGKPLFDILERWIAEVRKLDSRPVISNSNGDAANLVHKSVGDIDDVHQYGGWYTENLFDLRHFGEYTRKDDMLFQPCISTESIAAYTNDDGEFFIGHSDIRQKKVVAMRLGTITDLRQQAQGYQSFLLKEYAEALWRLRNPESSFAGYIPFGQYTWFRRPFQKGPEGLQPKLIWDTFRKVLGPVHVQLECFDRHLFSGGTLRGTLRLFHENIHLPDSAEFTIRVSCDGKTLLERTRQVAYHASVAEEVELGPISGTGKQSLLLEVSCAGEKVAWNDLELRLYPRPEAAAPTRRIVIFDPEKRLSVNGERLADPALIAGIDPENSTLVIGPHAVGAETRSASETIRDWMERGGLVIVLEQNPGPCSDNLFGTGLGSVRACQPQWSRWAMNLVKHADRADLCTAEHPMFRNLSEADLFWWNRDTFLAHNYICVNKMSPDDKILARIGNGLAEDELMPVEYDYRDSGFSLIAVERPVGKGRILFSSFLLGGKAAREPVAALMLDNLLAMK